MVLNQKKIIFSNPLRKRFTYTIFLYGRLPEAFSAIGVEGGVIEITDENSQLYGVKIKIPQNAVNGEKQISISQVNSLQFLPDDVISAGVAVDFGPDDTMFNSPVRINLPYNDQDNDGFIDGTAVSELEINVLNYDQTNNQLELADIIHIDTFKNIVTAEINHFSVWEPVYGFFSKEEKKIMKTWSRSYARLGEKISMCIEHGEANADGVFDVFEKDPFFSFDDYIASMPFTLDSSGRVKKEWIPVWQDDLLGMGGKPEYYFKIWIEDENGNLEELKSTSLELPIEPANEGFYISNIQEVDRYERNILKEDGLSITDYLHTAEKGVFVKDITLSKLKDNFNIELKNAKIEDRKYAVQNIVKAYSSFSNIVSLTNSVASTETIFLGASEVKKYTGDIAMHIATDLSSFSVDSITNMAFLRWFEICKIVDGKNDGRIVMPEVFETNGNLSIHFFLTPKKYGILDYSQPTTGKKSWYVNICDDSNNNVMLPKKLGTFKKVPKNGKIIGAIGAIDAWEWVNKVDEELKFVPVRDEYAADVWFQYPLLFDEGNYKIELWEGEPTEKTSEKRHSIDIRINGSVGDIPRLNDIIQSGGSLDLSNLDMAEWVIYKANIEESEIYEDGVNCFHGKGSGEIYSINQFENGKYILTGTGYFGKSKIQFYIGFIKNNNGFCIPQKDDSDMDGDGIGDVCVGTGLDFYDNFDEGFNDWTKFGSPQSQIVNVHGHENVFDNKGDSWCDSGVVSNESVDIEIGTTISSDVYIQVDHYRGCWIGAGFGLTNRTLSSSGSCAGENYNGVYLGTFSVSGSQCWASPSNEKGHSWISTYGQLLDGPTDNTYSRGQYQADDYTNAWHTLKAEIVDGYYVKLYIDDNYLGISDRPIPEAYRNNPYIRLGLRSSGIGGRAYMDNITVEK